MRRLGLLAPFSGAIQYTNILTSGVFRVLGRRSHCVGVRGDLRA